MTNNNPLVSIIITTYNREHLLKKAIESVLAQNYSNIEFIIIDNGSTDGTRALINSYAKNFPIKYVYQGNRNLYIETLNDGIRNAKGKYISILDDDDYFCDNNKTQKQVDFLEKNPDYVLVGGGLIGIDQKGQEIARYLLHKKDENIRKVLLISNTLAHTTNLFRKDIWEKVGGYDNGLDWGLWLKMGKEGKFYNMQEYFVVYREHIRGNLGYVKKKYTREQFLKMSIELRKKYRNDYSGYKMAILFCWLRYFYSFLPFTLPPTRQIWLWSYQIKRLRDRILNTKKT